MKTLIMTTAAALLIGGAAYAADETMGTAGKADDKTVVGERTAADLSRTFDEWDTNQDEYLSREEYEAGVSGSEHAHHYPTWDELDAAHADSQGRLLTEDYEKWYPAASITTGTSEDLGGTE